MGALFAALLARLAPFLAALAVRFFVAAGTFLAVLVGVLIEKTTHVFSTVLAFIVGKLLVLLFAVLGYLVGLLPDVLEQPSLNVAPLVSLLAQADRFVPVHEIGTLFVYWSFIYGGVLLYKSAKFIRGGG